MVWGNTWRALLTGSMKALGLDTMQKKSLFYCRIRNSSPLHPDVDNDVGLAMSLVAAEKCTGPWKEPVFNPSSQQY